ncbi:MAG: DNA polymerase III subunit beta [Oscillatoriales cyanobacterium SM2_2_1]|nr:DNA polymerase III subunit beta [Oscillatoriales cyanobacterium SM2_2_1]
MRFTCSQSLLIAQLAFVSRAVSSRPTHPILANIRLEADGDRQEIELVAYDLSLGIRVRVAAEVNEAGVLTLPAKLLNDIVAKLPAADVTVSVERNSQTAILTCGAGRYQVYGLTAEEFPALPQVDGTSQRVYLPVEAVLEGLNASLFASATDETKRILTGVHVTGSATAMEFAATDGHRLSVAEVVLLDEAVGAAPFALTVTIPARALRELERMLAQQTEQVIAVMFDQVHIIFQSAQQTLISRLLDGAYPNYRQLLPTKFERQLSLDRKSLIASLERIAVLADQRNQIVKLSISQAQQEVALTVEAPEVATGRELLTAQVSGEDLQIAFNIRYLLDGLKSMAASEVRLCANQANQPVVLQPISEQKATYLIMPVQIRD